MELRRGATALAFAGLVAAGCGGVTDPSKNRVENFSMVLDPGDRECIPITINNGGEYSVKITALSPTPTATLGMGWYQGGNCEFRILENYASLNVPALSGAVIQKGAYSVGVFDALGLPAAQNVTISVSHP
jgi:hypothetical protein